MAASPAPNVPWTPPTLAFQATADTTAAGLPADLADRVQRLTLADIVDYGLRNNAATRVAWA
ncbi:MAG: hypothetical protein H0U85_04425, partial [Gemmatimonadales bacterium]|nr:hypothetical protein [Gemmatimonadales bacterium]